MALRSTSLVYVCVSVCVFLIWNKEILSKNSPVAFRHWHSKQLAHKETDHI